MLQNRVVYHPFPTSNHNPLMMTSFSTELYIILFLHQTTTLSGISCRSPLLYIILFLHQTTTLIGSDQKKRGCISSFSYIKPQPSESINESGSCCISSFSYIKPQPDTRKMHYYNVVYHPFPTSNHNLQANHTLSVLLYIILFLHQTTTLWCNP